MGELVIASHRGPYSVRFGTAFGGLEDGLPANEHLVIDARVAALYADALAKALPGALRIEATEEHKSLERIAGYVVHLLERGIRRDHAIVAVGGGIIQDVACFIAATLLRGVPWRFYPTTLLAQADSCIGSKSSINVGRYKNQIGTFTPPSAIIVSPDVLQTLSRTDLRSGLGEIIKVHVLSGWDDLRALARDYPRVFDERSVLERYIRRSLEIKKTLIEIDEFDRRERLVLNYGHTFGHAIESATQYAVPHGIGVTIGMDFANYVAWRFGVMGRDVYDELHDLLAVNYGEFAAAEIPERAFFDALRRDKKNIGAQITLLLPRVPGDIFLDRYPYNAAFEALCREFLAQLPTAAARAVL